jgi:hypothetical protein
MATTIISCEECTEPYETTRPNTKFCSRCRLSKDVTFIDDHTVKCWQCEKVFAPIERGEKTCGECCYQPKKHGETTCVFCKNTRLRVRANVECCHECARNPKLRGKLIASLRNAQRRRRMEAINGQA